MLADMDKNQTNPSFGGLGKLTIVDKIPDDLLLRLAKKLEIGFEEIEELTTSTRIAVKKALMEKGIDFNEKTAILEAGEETFSEVLLKGIRNFVFDGGELKEELIAKNVFLGDSTEHAGIKALNVYVEGIQGPGSISTKTLIAKNAAIGGKVSVLEDAVFENSLNKDSLRVYGTLNVDNLSVVSDANSKSIINKGTIRNFETTCLSNDRTGQAFDGEALIAHNFGGQINSSQIGTAYNYTGGKIQYSTINKLALNKGEVSAPDLTDSEFDNLLAEIGKAKSISKPKALRVTAETFTPKPTPKTDAYLDSLRAEKISTPKTDDFLAKWRAEAAAQEVESPKALEVETINPIVEKTKPPVTYFEDFTEQTAAKDFTPKPTPKTDDFLAKWRAEAAAQEVESPKVLVTETVNPVVEKTKPHVTYFEDFTEHRTTAEDFRPRPIPKAGAFLNSLRAKVTAAEKVNKVTPAEDTGSNSNVSWELFDEKITQEMPKAVRVPEVQSPPVPVKTGFFSRFKNAVYGIKNRAASRLVIPGDRTLTETSSVIDNVTRLESQRPPLPPQVDHPLPRRQTGSSDGIRIGKAS